MQRNIPLGPKYIQRNSFIPESFHTLHGFICLNMEIFVHMMIVSPNINGFLKSGTDVTQNLK